MHAILSEVPFLTRCQGPLASVIMGLLNTHPEARPSAEQVAGLLSQITMTPANGFLAQTAAMTPQSTAHYAPPRKTRRWGVVTTVALAAAAALFAGGFATRIATEPEPGADRPPGMDTAITYGEGGHLPEFAWESYPEGDCINSSLAAGRRIAQSAHVECDQPHQFEVYQTRTFYSPPGDYDTWPDIDYPGHDGLVQYTESVCRMIFESKAMIPETREDDRDSYCVLYAPGDDQLDKSYLLVE
jgi:hypothetical protein